MLSASRDDAAGDPRPAIVGGVRLLVVLLSVNDQAGPARTKERIRRARLERDGTGGGVEPRRARRIDTEIGQVTSVRPFGVETSVLLPGGIEVGAGRAEVRRLAPADSVDVDSFWGREAIPRL